MSIRPGSSRLTMPLKSCETTLAAKRPARQTAHDRPLMCLPPYCLDSVGSIPLFRRASFAASEERKAMSRRAASGSFAPVTSAVMKDGGWNDPAPPCGPAAYRAPSTPRPCRPRPQARSRCTVPADPQLKEACGCSRAVRGIPASGMPRHRPLLPVENDCLGHRLAFGVGACGGLRHRPAVLGDGRSARHVVLPTGLSYFPGPRIRI